MAGSPIVTILGGGISGLSAAYYLTRLAPNVKVRLLEASQRVGGWIKSSHIDNKVIFEAGPRTLRPHGVAGTVLLDMIKELGLDNQVISVPKSHPSAKKRYIEYKREINQLPSGPKDLLFDHPQVMDSVIGSILAEPFQPSKVYSNDKNGDDDESIYSFIERRFNQHVALNLVGAITHGIYAGDCKELSIQSTFPFLAAYEKKYGSVIKGLIDNDTIQLDSQQELQLAKQCQSKYPSWQKELQGASVIGLLPGLEALPKALYHYLDQQPNVEILLNQKVTQLSLSSNEKNKKKITIKTNHHDQPEFETNHLISTLPSKSLHSLLPDLPHLNDNPAVNVAVVNLAYPKERLQPYIKEYDGFGFLTPHRDNPYPIKVPGLLGVIFDTNSMGIQDQDNGLIRMTCMIGGSDWDLAFGNEKLPSTLSSHAFQLAKKAITSYFNLPHAHDEKEKNQDIIEPSYYQVNLLNECLPQYLVGHPKRMLHLHHFMQQHYGHQLSVTGASYLGVSVGDCVKNSRLLIDNLVSRGTLGDQSMFVTGLEKSLQSI
ncbi:unnamed protein product [Cunninghamella blakesleeana]